MQAIVESLKDSSYTVRSVSVKEQAWRPAPFTTSTSNRRPSGGFSARRTMKVAQEPRVNVAGEGHVGLITYMKPTRSGWPRRRLRRAVSPLTTTVR